MDKKRQQAIIDQLTKEVADLKVQNAHLTGNCRDLIEALKDSNAFLYYQIILIRDQIQKNSSILVTQTTYLIGNQ